MRVGRLGGGMGAKTRDRDASWRPDPEAGAKWRGGVLGQAVNLPRQESVSFDSGAGVAGRCENFADGGVVAVAVVVRPGAQR